MKISVLWKVLCEKFHHHTWKYQKWISPMKQIYYSRKCKCGIKQVQSAGLRGDKEWHTLGEMTWQSWELEDYLVSKPYD